MGGRPIIVVPKEHHAVASKLKGKQLRVVVDDQWWEKEVITWKRRRDASLESSKASESNHFFIFHIGRDVLIHPKLIVEDYSSSTVFSLPMNVHILKAVKSPVAYRAGSIFTPLQIVSKVHKKHCKAPHTISRWISDIIELTIYISLSHGRSNETFSLEPVLPFFSSH
jgi:hypothetical protein